MSTPNDDSYKKKQREAFHLPGQNRGFIPQRNYGGALPVPNLTRGASGGRLARYARNKPFFVPTHFVYGYNDEATFTLQHTNVVFQQRLRPMALTRSTLIPQDEVAVSD